MCEVHCDHQLLSGQNHELAAITGRGRTIQSTGAAGREASLLLRSSFISSPAVPSSSSSSSSAPPPSPPPPPLLTPRLLPPPPPDLIPPCNYHLRLQLKATTIKAAEEGGRGEVSGVGAAGGWWLVLGGGGGGGEFNEPFVRTCMSELTCTPRGAHT